MQGSSSWTPRGEVMKENSPIGPKLTGEVSLSRGVRRFPFYHHSQGDVEGVSPTVRGTLGEFRQFRWVSY